MKFIDNETELGKINMLERWIIFHSIMYYERNLSIISDYDFDMNAKQLYSMMKGSDFENSRWYYVFIDFNGCSGFDLYSKLIEEDKNYFNKIIDRRR